MQHSRLEEENKRHEPEQVKMKPPKCHRISATPDLAFAPAGHERADVPPTIVPNDASGAIKSVNAPTATD
jgi:hypothetical protein